MYTEAGSTVRREGRESIRLALALLWGLSIVKAVAGDEAGDPTLSNNLNNPFLRGRCMFAVEDEKVALERAEDTSIPGSVVNVTDLNSGRLGNHFGIASRFLALGYCCKSKLVILPPKDPILAPGIFGEGTPGPRYFDFSDAPAVPDFDPTASCRDEYTIGGRPAYRENFRIENFPSGWSKNEPLTACIERTRQVNCEAAYFFPAEIDVCDSHVDEEHAEADVSASTDPKSLVIHVRSGDIFRSKRASGVYGQPPLSYYTALLNSREWDRVDILTFVKSSDGLNPILPVLEILIKKGSWPRTKFNMYTKRDITDDLQAMLCADALATSRSTLGGVTMYHTRASTVYFPCTCNGEDSELGLTPKRVIDARSNQEENFKVIGIELKPNAPPYTVYDKVERFDNGRLRLNMLTYSGVSGLITCS
ncbi:unnamed protein product [Ascophyllum nodosum]